MVPMPKANVFITNGLMPVTAAACLSMLTARKALPVQVRLMKYSSTPISTIPTAAATSRLGIRFNTPRRKLPAFR